MTREEAIANLKMSDKYCLAPFTEAINMAIKALEQEPVIDKIRAEILRKSYGGFELGEGFRDGYNTAMVRVLNILDKYRAESEED